MAIQSSENSVAAWSFFIGVVLAIIIGLSATILPLPTLVAYSKSIYGVLIVLGLIIGFAGARTGKDSQTFLLAGAVLVVVSKFGMESVTGSLIGVGIGDAVASVFAALLALFVPATIIVALKNLFVTANV